MFKGSSAGITSGGNKGVSGIERQKFITGIPQSSSYSSFIWISSHILKFLKTMKWLCVSKQQTKFLKRWRCSQYCPPKKRLTVSMFTLEHWLYKSLLKFKRNSTEYSAKYRLNYKGNIQQFVYNLIMMRMEKRKMAAYTEEYITQTTNRHNYISWFSGCIDHRLSLALTASLFCHTP